MPLDALVFDAYGTLFDVHSVIERCESLWPGKSAVVSHLWRTKQLEYTWQRSLMSRYENFEAVTEHALRYACEFLALPCQDEQVNQLMDEYRNLRTFPEVESVLPALGKRKRAILSNGSPGMLDAVVRNAGMAQNLEAVLSVDSLGLYKPDPRVYRLAVDALGVEAGRIGFVSSNCWDACGAQAFGFHTFWINRTGAPVDRLGANPEHILKSLADLPEVLE
jgi:2-haloacid dehalogenase